MKITVLRTSLVVALFCFGVMGNTSAEETGKKEIVEKLEQIVTLRQSQLERQKAEVEGGLQLNAIDAEIALCRARLELARERNELDHALAELRQIESWIEKKIKEQESLANLGRGSVQTLMEHQIELLEVQIEQIRLETELKGAAN
ncbi:MAG TPA: hypothetical protein PLA50_18780 [Bacteroidia bacterium]|nr:hypothetical protein [Bacteroidia bacterium]